MASSSRRPGSPTGKQSTPARARRRKSSAASRRNWGAIGTVVAVFVIGAGIVAAAVLHNSGQGSSASLQGVKTFSHQGGQHTAGYFDPVTYQQSPPVGGEHNPIWENCGVYDQPIRNGNAVHSLEHGTVWITYRPDLSPSDVATLADTYVAKQEYMMISPYADQDSPIVLTAWDRQLAVNSVDDPRIKAFITAYRSGKTTPERGSACDGGVGTPSDRQVTDNTAAIKAAADKAGTGKAASTSPAPSAS